MNDKNKDSSPETFDERLTRLTSHRDSIEGLPENLEKREDRLKTAIRDEFDRILGRQWESLTGRKTSLATLPFNLATMSLFILLGGREIDIAFSPAATKPPRFTIETLVAAISISGIEPDETVKNAIFEMISNNYIEIGRDDMFICKKPVTNMTHLLRRVFPQITGHDLLSYIGQTIEEVTTGRTSVADAIARLEKTLSTQAMPQPKPRKSETKPVTEKPAATFSSYKYTPRADEPKSHIIKDYVVTSPGKRQDSSTRNGRPSQLHHASEDINSPKPPTSPKTAASGVRQPPEPVPSLPGAKASDDRGMIVSPKDKAPAVSPIKSQKETSQQEVSLPAREKAASDADIERKVAAFENKLALYCPLCHNGTLAEKSTAAGKTYFACTAENCKFISWSKPHHVACARCKNPFMVETKDDAGQIILQCPLSTCRHRQALSPKTKLVRRRLVRRRK